jgi:hypothetical protein
LTKLKGCVIIRYEFIFDNKHRHDADNYIAGAKYIQDALRDTILDDDSMEVVKGIEFSCRVDKERKTIITIRSV